MNRPRVLVNCALSLDGKLNPSPHLRRGEFAMSRGEEDPRRMRQLRAHVDAIVIGASNLRADDPDLALAPVERAARRARGEREPLRVVVTRAAFGLTRAQKIFDPTLGGETVVAHTTALHCEAVKQLGGVATLIECGGADVEIPRLLRWLAAERGVSSVLCEGGGVINAAFFAARSVDELYLTLCPRILGGFAAPSLVAGLGFSPDALPDASLESIVHLGDELYVHYDFQWEERAVQGRASERAGLMNGHEHT
jgi:riboflavin-specific deaminase-like protein